MDQPYVLVLRIAAPAIPVLLFVDAQQQRREAVVPTYSQEKKEGNFLWLRETHSQPEEVPWCVGAFSFLSQGAFLPPLL